VGRHCANQQVMISYVLVRIGLYILLGLTTMLAFAEVFLLISITHKILNAPFPLPHLTGSIGFGILVAVLTVIGFAYKLASIFSDSSERLMEYLHSIEPLKVLKAVAHVLAFLIFPITAWGLALFLSFHLGQKTSSTRL
jgi:hypothetical protein